MDFDLKQQKILTINIFWWMNEWLNQSINQSFNRIKCYLLGLCSWELVNGW